MTSVAQAIRPSRPHLPEGCHPLRLGDVFVDALPREKLPQVLDGMVSAGEPRRLSVCRARDVLQARQDVRFRNLLLASDLVLGTGLGFRWLARIAGERLRTATNPAELAELTLGAAVHHGWRVFFLGTDRDATFDYAHGAQQRYPGLKLVGAAGASIDRADTRSDARLVARVNEARPDILLETSAHSSPRGFTSHYREHINVPVIMIFHGGVCRRLLDNLSVNVSALPGYFGLALATWRR